MDKGGKSAADYAKDSGHTGVAQRIANSCYELSDRLSFFLCQKKPNHSSGQHFLVPEIEINEKSGGGGSSKFKLLADTFFVGNLSLIITFSSFHSPPAASNDSRKVSKRKMQGLPNSVFEELAMDVHDEVDRRETDAIWAAVESVSVTKKSAILPFLPVNPDYGKRSR